ncbi:MAG: hypothetical protein MAG794_00767 [Gammaproteobacteria bacterium]|nr:hypothetical protein [Gammaproteobacteria bacterium]
MKLKALFLFLILLGVGTVMPARPDFAQVLPETVKLVYDVRLYGTELGNLITELTKNGETYQVRSETRAEGLAAVLLGGTLWEECEFTVSEDLEIQPRRYRIEKEGRNAYSHSAEFLWNEKKVRYDNGNLLDIPPTGYLIDNCTVPFAFAAADKIILKEYPYIHILGGKRIRHFEDIEISRETIEVPAGEFDTVRIDQQRVGSTEKKLSIWVAPNKQNIAVKIVERRRFRVTTMELSHGEGLGNNP